MSHSKCRRLSAVVVIIILSLVALVPAAHARPLASGETAFTSVSWFDMALSWLQSLLPGGGERSEGGGRLAGTFAQATKVTPPAGGDLIVVPNTGSCIDPQGNPRPWCQF